MACSYCNDGGGLYGPCPLCGHSSDLEGADTLVEVEGRPISLRWMYLFIVFICISGWFLWNDAVDYARLAVPFKLVEGFYYHAMIAPMKAYWDHNLTPFPRFNVLLSLLGIAAIIGVPLLAASSFQAFETKTRRRMRTAWKYLNGVFLIFMAPALFAVVWWVCVGLWHTVSFAFEWLFAVK